MSAWWDEHSGLEVRLDEEGRPILVEPQGPAIASHLRELAPRYVPEWLGHGRPEDAGEAFNLLYGDMARTVASRVNRLPEKMRVEFFRAAGVVPELGTPARTLVQFEGSRASRTPVLLGKGFKVGGAPADGDGERVIFETERDVYVSGATLEQVLVQDGSFRHEVTANDPEGSAFEAFPGEPDADDALWLGISAERHPGTQLSLAIGVAPSTEKPSTQLAGGVGSEGSQVLPVLEWTVQDGGRIRNAQPVFDSTAGLTQSGLVELRTPRAWAPSAGPRAGSSLYWIRLRVARGRYASAVMLQYVFLDCTAATASATERNEVLEQLDDRRWQLRERPVVPGSLEIEIDDTAARLAGTELEPWTEVDDLSDQPPGARVYTLDPTDGIVTFGDGVTGAAPPVGFRHIRALRYRVSFGASSAVDAGGLDQLLDAAPRILSVRNPISASGGTDPEPSEDALRMGPAALRARGRAVAVADFGVLALQAPGASVERAVAVSGLHPDYPGAAQPGLVGVLVVGRPGLDGPPTPDEGTLAAVARHLSRVGPAGAQIAVGAPRFQEVRAELQITVDTGAAVSETVQAVLAELDRYLDPLEGGDDGAGFPYGAPIRHARILRRLLAVPGVRAVPLLSFIVDGLRHPSCSDVPLLPWALPWPGSHTVVPGGVS